MLYGAEKMDIFLPSVILCQLTRIPFNMQKGGTIHRNFHGIAKITTRQSTAAKRDCQISCRAGKENDRTAPLSHRTEAGAARQRCPAPFRQGKQILKVHIKSQKSRLHVYQTRKQAGFFIMIRFLLNVQQSWPLLQIGKSSVEPVYPTVQILATAAKSALQ